MNIYFNSVDPKCQMELCDCQFDLIIGSSNRDKVNGIELFILC